MRRKQDQLGRIGDFYLSRRDKSPAWCRTWFDASERQTRRASLGTSDLAEAKRLLADWFAHNVTLKRAKPDEAKLADIFMRYWQDHARHIESADSAKVHLRVTLELMDGDPLVSDFGIAEQELLVSRLRKRYSASSTKRYFATVAASIRWAWRREIITSHRPLLERLPGGAPRERVVSVEELAAFWDAAEAEHLRAFIMVLLCTGCRPGAALELSRFTCDLDRGLVKLNPPGRDQGKKRRPMLPMVKQLRPWVEIADGHIVQFAGKPIKSVKTIWKATRLSAGLSADVSPMTIRHTVASELARLGVPDFQRQCWMGHHASNTTDRNYVHVKPDFLREASEAVEGFINEIDRMAVRSISPVNSNAVRAKCVLAI